MTILFVTENLGSGGAERQLSGLATILSRDGHDCTVVTWVDKNFHAQSLAENGVAHILLHPTGRLDRIIKLAAVYRQLNPDAVIAFLPMANETALLSSLLYPVKVVVSERSFTTDWGVRRKLTNLLYRRAYRIVANSFNEAQNLKTHMPSLAKRIIAIPNFVDASMFDSSIDRGSIGESHQLKLIGVGRVIPSKNIDRLIDALSILRDQGYRFDLKWYGDTYDSEYLQLLNTKISKLGMSNSFKLMGECHNMPEAYATADYFVMPSLHEGYPNVLVEAMACELPVAVSAVCEHPYIIEDEINGFLFDPTNTQDMVSAIKKMLTLTSTQRAKIGRRNREKILANNSMESFKQQYLAIL